MAYYCFTNLGWSPKKYTELEYNERALVKEFVLKDLMKRKKMEEGGYYGGY